MKKGFSLVELSIVLVILGLLTGGILAGQSLIHAAELRAVTVEYQRYFTATQSFRDKYFAIPGDFSTATAFWGKDNTNCSGDTGTTATPGTCNGNNDSKLGAAAAASSTGEAFQYWKQLALAGLVEGNYTGLSGSGGTSSVVIGSNIPRSKLTSAGWCAWYSGPVTGSSYYYTGDYGNVLFIGAANGIGLNNTAVLKPEDAWNLDTKMDDGKPGTGKIFAGDMPGFGTATACTTSTSATDYAGNYNLSNSTASCVPFFMRAF